MTADRGTRRAAVTAAAMPGMFLAAMDQTAAGTAMPALAGTVGGLPLYSRVRAASRIAFVVTTPICGHLADLSGRKRVYLAGILGLVAVSALSGLSRTMGQLAAFRLLQGIGGGAALPIALTIVGVLFPIEERSRIRGIFSGVWGPASIGGPAVGGFLTDHLTCRRIFFLNAPAGVGATALLLALHEPPASDRGQAGHPGAGLLAASTILLLLAWGDHSFSWLSLPTVGLAVATALLFVRVEARGEHPPCPSPSSTTASSPWAPWAGSS